MVVKISFLSWRSDEAAAVRFLRAVAGAGQKVLRTLRHRRAVQRLSELDDRALKDIGLLRGDVEGALLEPFLVDPSARLASRRLERGGRAPM